MKIEFQNVKNYFSKASVNKKLYVFLVCLVLSTFYWLINSLSNKYTANLEIGIVYENQPNDYVILNNLPSKLQLKVNAIGYDLLGCKLAPKLKQIHIDLSKYKRDLTLTSTVHFNEFKDDISNQLGSKIELKGIYPNNTQVVIDKRISKFVKVVSDIKLQFKNQYQLTEDIQINPKKIIVYGPKSILDTLKEIPTTNFVLTALDSKVRTKIQLNQGFLKKNRLETKKNKVEIIANVEKYTELRMELPIFIKNNIDSLDVQFVPNNVEVKFMVPLSKLATLNQNDFEAFVDLSEVSYSYKKLKVYLHSYPLYVKDMIIAPSNVEYVFKRNNK